MNLISNLLGGDIPGLAISFVMSFCSAFLVYFFMSRLLPNRLNIPGILALSLIYTLWFNLRSPELFGTSYHLAMSVFINIWTPFIVIFLYKGSFWKRVIVYWYFDTIKVICEAIAFVPVMLYDSHAGARSEWSRVALSIETDIPLRLVYALVFLSLFLLFGFLSLKIWRKLLLREFHMFYILFFILPLGQMYSLSLLIRPNMGNLVFGLLLNTASDVETLYYLLSILGVLVCVIADAAILYYIFTHSKRSAIEAELFEVSRIMELERARYLELERHQDELAKIRHDFNNQLATVTQLAIAGDFSSAQELIHSLEKEIAT